MATIFPNTSNFSSKVYNNFSLKPDNDLTLSSITAEGTFNKNINDNIHVGLNRSFTRNRSSNAEQANWFLGSSSAAQTDFSYKIFDDVPPSYIEEISDNNNNFRKILKNILPPGTGIGVGVSETQEIGKGGYIVPVDGTYKFSIKAKGEASIFDGAEGRGGYFNLKLIKYPAIMLSDFTIPYEQNSTIDVFETLPLPLIKTSSQYNVELKTKHPFLRSSSYTDTSNFGIAGSAGTILPFNTIHQDNSNIISQSISTEINHYDYPLNVSSTHLKINAPHSGSYKFNVKIEGGANITTDIITPLGFQGTFTTPNKTITATLFIKKQDTSGNFTTQYTETKDITVGGVSITDPNPGDTSFTDTRRFDLDSIFDTTGINIELDENESALAFIKLTTPNNLGSQAFSENINGIPGFGLTLTNNFFSLKDTSFFKIVEYTSSLEDNKKVFFNIEQNDIELSLQEGDAIALCGRIRGIQTGSDTSGIGGPLISGTFAEPHQFIESITIYSGSTENNHFKVTQAINNPHTSGEFISQIGPNGNNLYQPLYGSFYVDLSKINATPNNPVKVSIPLNSIDQFSFLGSTRKQTTSSLIIPDSRRFLNHSLELNVTTTSNNTASGLLGITQLTNTNATYGSNFIHYGSALEDLTYNSALLTRFDQVGNGFTGEDLLNGILAPPDDDIVDIDNIIDVYFNQNSIYGIYEGGADIDTSDIPEGALFSPRIVLKKENNKLLFNKTILVRPSSSFAPGFYQPAILRSTNHVGGALGWFNNDSWGPTPGYVGLSSLNPIISENPLNRGYRRYEFLHPNNKYHKKGINTPDGPFYSQENVPYYIDAVFDGAWLNAYAGQSSAAPPINNKKFISLDKYNTNPFGDNYNVPRVTPYLDQAEINQSNCWKTSSNSPTRFLDVAPHGNWIGHPSASDYNFYGASTSQAIDNHYLVPATGFYNVSYLFEMIVQGVGGTHGVLGSGPTTTNPSIEADVSFYNIPIAPPQPTAEAGGLWSVLSTTPCYNTLYGVIRRTPTLETGLYEDVIGIPRVCATSSLGYVTDFGNSRTYWYLNNGVLTFAASNFDIRPVFGGAPNERYIDEQLTQIHLGPNTDFKYEWQYNFFDITWPSEVEGYGSEDYALQYTYQNSPASVNAMNSINYSPWVFWDSLGNAVDIDFQINENQSVSMDFNVDSSQLLFLLNQMQAGDVFDEFGNYENGMNSSTYNAYLNQSFQEFIAEYAGQLDDNYLQITIPSTGPFISFVGDDFDAGAFIFDTFRPSFDTDQDFVTWANSLNTQNGTDYGIQVFGDDDVDDAIDFYNAYMAQFNLPGVDESGNTTYAASQQGDDDYNELNNANPQDAMSGFPNPQGMVNIADPEPTSYGIVHVADQRKIFFYKGDKIHIDVALGPIQTKNHNQFGPIPALKPWFQTNPPTDGVPITGSYHQISSVGACFFTTASLLTISPSLHYDSQISPHFEFIATQNVDTVVKGTYKYF